MKKLIFILLWPLSALANPNACDDYINRHYKKDLVAQALQFQNQKTRAGRVYQDVKITLKNQGQVDMNALSSETSNRRTMKVRINGIQRNLSFSIPFDSGTTQVVTLRMPARTLSHCKDAEVAIDLDHTAGQWGCQVWNNDVKQIKAYIPRKICPRFPLPRLPLPTPRI